MKKPFLEIAAVVPMLVTLAICAPSAHAQKFSEWSGHGSRETIFTPIDFPDAILTGANGISAGGKIVGAYDRADRTHHGFLLDGDFETIDFPDAATTFGFGINAQGDVTGDYADPDGRFHGFLWRGGGSLPQLISLALSSRLAAGSTDAVK